MMKTIQQPARQEQAQLPAEPRNEPRAGSTGYREGALAKRIEEKTAKLPSDLFLWAAGGSILTSLALQLSGRRQRAVFVGQWAPTFLLLGVYNKVVKLQGSESVA